MRTPHEGILFAGWGKRHLTRVHLADADHAVVESLGERNPAGEILGKGGGELGMQGAEVGGPSRKDGPSTMGMGIGQKDLEKARGNWGTQWRGRGCSEVVRRAGEGVSEGRGLTPPSPAWSAAQGEPYSTLGRTLCAGKMKEPLSGLGN